MWCVWGGAGVLGGLCVWCVVWGARCVGVWLAVPMVCAVCAVSSEAGWGIADQEKTQKKEINSSI